MASLTPSSPPFRVTLVSPQIPANVGNVARTCAVTGCPLHLVGPIRFSLDEKSLRRAGLDYWESLAPDVHAGWLEFEARALEGQIEKLHLFSGRARRDLFGVRFEPGDFLVFGAERTGLHPGLLDAYPERCVGIPMLPGQRSLNLATAVGIAVYQALRCVALPSCTDGAARPPPTR